MRTLLLDLKHGARVLVTHPGPYAAAFVTLALGLAAATTMFSIVNTVLLEPLPYVDANRLALVWDRTGDSSRDVWLSPPEFADLRERSRAFADAAALTDRRYTLTGRNEPEELQAAAVTPNLFDMIGVRAAAGRAFQPGDDTHERGLVAVISEPVAERLFGGGLRAVGQTLTLDGQAWTVIGVVPRAFALWPPSAVFPRHVDVWVPIDSETYSRAGRNQNYLHALVRLRPDVDFAQASADIARVSQSIAADHPEQYKDQRWRMTLVGLQEHLVAGVRPAILVLFAAVGVLLLIACANVANLLLARAAARSHEMAVRAALGASRGRLLRQVLTESLMLASAAAAAGALVAAWAVTWVSRAGPVDVPRLETARVDMPVLAFSIGLALVSTLCFGAAPALQLSLAQPGERLEGGVRGSTGGPRSRRLRATFAVAQLALAVVLTVSTGLLLKAFIRIGRTDSGFIADALVTARIRLPLSKYPRALDRAAFFTTLTERLGSRDDIASAAAVTQLPMSGAFLGSSFALTAGDTRASAVEFGADLRGVTSRYFETMGIRVISGRGFAEDDRADSRLVAVVDETLARRFWPNGDAVGRQLRWVRTNDVIEIVGVVAPVRHYGLSAAPRETVYRPYTQYAAIPEMFVEAQSPGGFEAARAAVVEEVRRLDAEQPVADIGRVDRLVEASLGQPRFNTLLLSVFAAMALLLAAIGVYGVMAFAVSERTREIGVRMALGADAAAVSRMIVRDGAIVTALGVGAGVLLALVLARGLRTLLFGVSPWDPAVFGGVAALLATVALVASYLPARRAATLDPTIALRA